MAAKKKEADGMVTIKIPYEKNKSDLFVGLNGKNYQIKRGVEVRVPEGVAEILENTARMDELVIIRQSELAGNVED